MMANEPPSKLFKFENLKNKIVKKLKSAFSNS